jgi:hypothetical protein
MTQAAGRTWVLPLVMSLLIVLAPLPLLGADTSLGLHVLVLLGLVPLLLLRPSARQVPGWWLLGLVGVLLLHTLWTMNVSPCRDMLGRSLASLGLLIGALVALALAASAAVQERVRPGRSLMAMAVLVLLSVLAHKAWLLATGASPLIRPSGIYEEPSHLALSCAPLLAALVVSDRSRERWVGWVVTAGLMALAASATLFVLFAGCALVALVAVAPRGATLKLILRVLLVAGAAVALVLASPFRDDFIDRVSGVGAEASAQSNISSLIYLNGAQSALDNFLSTEGLGLGVNRMGCEPRPVTDVTSILEAFELGDYNYNDGSFTAAKLFSEFGVLGGVWLLIGLVAMMQLVAAGRREPDPDRRQLFAFCAAALFVVTVGAFVRGTGYFSGPFMMGLFAFFLSRRCGRLTP